jgi:hypothetical protein
MGFVYSVGIPIKETIMIATSINPKTHINRLSRKILRSQPLQVKACEIDGYGSFGCKLADEMQVALPRLGAKKPVVDIPAEAFEAVYCWFWS